MAGSRAGSFFAFCRCEEPRDAPRERSAYLGRRSGAVRLLGRRSGRERLSSHSPRARSLDSPAYTVDLGEIQSPKRLAYFSNSIASRSVTFS